MASEPEESRVHALFGVLRDAVFVVRTELTRTVMERVEAIEEDPRYQAPSPDEVLGGALTHITNLLLYLVRGGAAAAPPAAPADDEPDEET